MLVPWLGRLTCTTNVFMSPTLGTAMGETGQFLSCPVSDAGEGGTALAAIPGERGNESVRRSSYFVC